MIKAVIFDFDDTLFRTKEFRIKAIQNGAYRFYKLKIPQSKIRKIWGKPIHIFWQELFGQIDTYENIMKNYLSLIPEYPNKPYPDAFQTIEILLQTYKVGILSSSARDLVLPELVKHKFAIDKFIHIQTAEETDVHKPDPAVFRPLLNKLKGMLITTSEILYVGDTLHDYQAARNAGINFIGIARRSTSNRDFRKVGARTVRSLNDLHKII